MSLSTYMSVSHPGYIYLDWGEIRSFSLVPRLCITPGKNVGECVKNEQMDGWMNLTLICPQGLGVRHA